MASSVVSSPAGLLLFRVMLAVVAGCWNRLLGGVGIQIVQMCFLQNKIIEHRSAVTGKLNAQLFGCP